LPYKSFLLFDSLLLARAKWDWPKNERVFAA
jgi:hypothetical protein